MKGVDDAKALRSPRPSGRDLDMAVQLVGSMTAEWDPSNYHDTYRHEVEELIEAKRQGRAVVVTGDEEAPAPVVDLRAALEASVRRVGGSGGKAGGVGGKGGGPRRGGGRTKPRSSSSSGGTSPRRGGRRAKAS